MKTLHACVAACVMRSIACANACIRSGSRRRSPGTTRRVSPASAGGHAASRDRVHELQSVLHQPRGRRCERQDACASMSFGTRTSACSRGRPTANVRHALRRARRHSVQHRQSAPAADEVESTGFGLGDVLITPVSLYGKSAHFDYQVQLTVWTASGRFSPGATDNRGTGFGSLVYSLGGVYYPGGIARLEPVRGGPHRTELRAGRVRASIPATTSSSIGVSGRSFMRAAHRDRPRRVRFRRLAADDADGRIDAADVGRYRFFGAGPRPACP